MTLRSVSDPDPLVQLAEQQRAEHDDQSPATDPMPPPANPEQAAADLDEANTIAAFHENERIVRSVVHGEGPEAEYDLHHRHGARVEGIKLAHLFDPRKMDPLLTQACPRSEIPWCTPKEWRPFAQAIVRAADRASVGTTRDEETREWLAAFIEAANDGATPPRIHLHDPAELHRALVHDHPVLRGHDERLYVRQSKLLAFVTAPPPRGLGQRTTRGDLERRLGRLDFGRLDTSESRLSARNDDAEPPTPPTVARRVLRSRPGFDPT